MVELLVALALSSLLLGFVFSLQLFANKLVFEWEKRAEVEETASFCMHALCRDIQNAEGLLSAGRQRIRFTDDEKREIKYELRDHRIIRNGRELNKTKILVDDFQLTYFFRPAQTTGGYSSTEADEELDENLNLRLDGEELDRVTGVEIRLEMSGQRNKIILHSFVRLKKYISVY